VDGEDHHLVRKDLLGKGLYYKREFLFDDFDDSKDLVRPINFAIPKGLIVHEIPHKEKKWATIVPSRLDTYIYNNEKAYFGDYQRSKYAITKKKYGWDCLRYYETLMSGVVPYFPNLDKCPNNILTLLPTSKLINLKKK